MPIEHDTPPAAQTPDARHRRRMRQARALIIGTAIILAGIAISPLPGPGFTILGPIGLGILAGEFMWARRIRQRLESGERSVRGVTDMVAVQISRWFIVPVLAVYFGAAWIVYTRDLIPHWLFWAVAFPSFIPFGYLALRIAAVRARHRAERNLADGPRGSLAHDAATTAPGRSDPSGTAPR